ncbi:PREDICTED: uncharacterized protein LOC109238697 isoform X1 [Nicotiana attenuata]|uniref:uncharacterized protein LOC109238697 isoform X1 n=1 Tax=Nicotiana attenuata TaxID=49451 RepID=UPI000904A746|nr:PREDICTED: uncharacterized protein LOC109238697 isoform X1 [Nicotiana attenuata]
MTHLPVHLVNEIKLGDTAHLHWMYPIERSLCKYKAFVRNRSCPEASIAEGFLADECLTFCSRYLHDGVKTKFTREHKNLIVNHSRSNAWERARNHSQEFSNWFKEKVENIVVPEYLRWLAKGPNMVAKRYTSYFINGYRFHTKERDSRCKTQNSGVSLSATTDSFASARGPKSRRWKNMTFLKTRRIGFLIQFVLLGESIKVS